MTPPERAPDNPPPAEPAASPPPPACPPPAAATATERGPRPAHPAGPAPLPPAAEPRALAETAREPRTAGGRGGPATPRPSAPEPHHPALLGPRPHPADPTEDGRAEDGRAAPALVRSDEEECAPARSGGAGAPGPCTPRTPPGERRRGRYVDPVRRLLHQHRELCERAVDPWEIAAGLEARGVGDRSAARYRHRDVFSLAEELYARTPWAGALADDTAPPPTAGATGASSPGALVPSRYGPVATAYAYPAPHAPYADPPHADPPYVYEPFGHTPCGHAAPGGPSYGLPARPAGAPLACPRASSPRAGGSGVRRRAGARGGALGGLGLRVAPTSPRAVAVGARAGVVVLAVRVPAGGELAAHRGAGGHARCRLAHRPAGVPEPPGPRWMARPRTPGPTSTGGRTSVSGGRPTAGGRWRPARWAWRRSSARGRPPPGARGGSPRAPGAACGRAWSRRGRAGRSWAR